MSSHFKQRIEIYRQPAYTLFSISGLLSMFGNGLTFIIMSWLIVSSGHSIGAMSIFMLCFWLPSSIFGPVMGVLVDRYSRRFLIVLSNYARAAMWIGFGVVYYWHMSLLLLDILAFVSGVMWALYFPAAIGFVREIVGEKQLLIANANLDMIYELGTLIGMSIAGFMLAIFSAPACIIINGVCYFLSASLMLFVRYQSQLKKYVHFSVAKLRQDFREGLEYIKSRQELKLMYSAQVLLFVTYMTAPLLLVPFAKSVLHTTVTELGVLNAALSLAAVASGVLTPWLAQRYGYLQVSFWMVLCCVLGFLGFAIERNILIETVLYFIVGWGIACWPVMVTTAQDMTDNAFQGRVQACFNAVVGAAIILAYLAVNFLGDVLSMAWLYSVEVLASVLCMWLIGRLILFKRAAG